MQIFTKIFLFLTAIIVTVNAASENFCYSDVVNSCKSPDDKRDSIANCTAKYGGIQSSLGMLQKYANLHIMRSFEYLMMSTHFGNYEKNRPGFEKLFRKLSDDTWEDGINIIKYIGKRGENMNFDNVFNMDNNNDDNKASLLNRKTEAKGQYELYELQSLSKALDLEKNLAIKAFKIHEEATRRHSEVHDPEISSYIEEHFTHKHADTIRNLAGHITDLSKMLSSNDHSLSLFMFDEYLSKM